MKYSLLAAAALGLPVAYFAQPAADVTTPDAQRISNPEAMPQGDLPSVPLAFAANMGQLDSEALFSARGNSMHAFFTKDAMVFRLFDEWEETDGGRYSRGSNLFMNFEGGGASDIVATDPLQAKSNYFFGNDPEAWVTNVPMYGAIEYKHLYEGIDLAVHNKNGGFEYDFELAPGVDPSAIALSFDGADSARVDAAGSLVVETPAGTFSQKAPTTWQVLENGETVEVDSRFNDLGNGRFGFELGNLDDSLATVIDPVLIWATYLGGAACERITALDVDEDLNVYATGMTMGSDFPTTAGAFDTTADVRHEGIAFKLSSDGTTLLWSSYFGGEFDDHPNGLALVGGTPGQHGGKINRSPVIVGTTASWTFPTTAGSFQPFKGAATDGFAIRFSPDGSALDWSSFIGDRDMDAAFAIDSNKADEVVIAGDSQSVGFGSAGAFQTVKNSQKDAFVAKISADGSTMLWSTFIGGNAHDWAFGVDFDDNTDEVAVCGSTHSTDFPVTPGAIGSTFMGAGDAWAARLKADGSGLVFGTYLSGSAIDVAWDIGTDDSGRTYVVGYTDSIDYPTTLGATQTMIGGMRDGFVTAIEPLGAGLVYSTYLGGGKRDEIRSLDLDFLGVAFVTGWTESVDFPVTSNPVSATNGGYRDVFVTQIERDDLFLEFSTYIGAGDMAVAESIAHDFGTGAITGGGRTRTGFPTTAGAFDTTYNGGSGDFMVFRITPDSCVLKATAQTMGVPCGATLTATPAVMAQSLTATITGASPNAPVFVFRSGAGATPIQLEGCDIFLDLSFYSIYPLFTDAAGTATGSLIVPNDSARCGLQFVLQALVLDATAGPLSFGQITNAVLETMGS